MIQKITQRINFYKDIRFLKYLYLNYFCKQVIRTDQSRVIPYKNAVLELQKGAKLYVGGGDVEIGCDQLAGSKAETRVRLRNGAVWSNEGGCRISYGTTLEVLQNAVLDSRFFTMNSNCVLVAAKRIALGHDVMIGRGVVIYDSDHHTLRNGNQEVTNPDAPVVIGDHVWLATNAMVLKGTILGSGTMVAANAVAHGVIPQNVIYQTTNIPKVRENYGTWSREHPAN
jgi:acetyltransferase-like isoleucine patch superfamily enzyme